MATEGLQTFKYEARTLKGEFVEGKVKATNQAAVAEAIAKEGYIPLDIKPISALEKDLKIGNQKIKPALVAQFMRQFATLIDAGIPITKSLDVLGKQATNLTFKQQLTDIKKDIDSGSRLGEALEKHPLTFSPLAVSMINAGESGGFLKDTLDSVANNLESDIKLRAQIKSAMTYPVAVLILAGLLVTAMLLFIVPIFDEMFTSLGGDLPVPTKLLVSASEFMKIGGIPIAVVIIGCIIWWGRNKNKESIRRFVDPIKLKMPIFGKLIQKIAVARFSRNFGSLLEAGLPLMSVLDIVGATSGSTVMEDALQDVKVGVSQGENIAPQLAKHDIFPPMLCEMVSIGEGAGEIPMMLNKIAKAYEDDVEIMTASLSSLMEPIMLVILGATVGSIVIALYLPIFSITELVE